MLTLVIVVISGWFLASLIGTWAYFVAESEKYENLENKILPFANVKKETYRFLREQRAAKLKSQGKTKAYGQAKTVY
jgi:uncharacterized membrane protein SpoIIM required for sporulation